MIEVLAKTDPTIKKHVTLTMNIISAYISILNRDKIFNSLMFELHYSTRRITILTEENGINRFNWARLRSTLIDDSY